MEGPSARDVRARLLAWYDAGHRDMPWRHTQDPYRILVAEYLLQRTRVASGTPYYERFLARFPSVGSLATASEEDVLRAWEGLGFYRRARNLHAAAKSVVRDHGGQIPSDAQTLATLPGVGPYTAGAVASIAFGEAVPAVDGNVTRVLSRLFRVDVDVATPAGRSLITAHARELVDPDRPAAFNQALMEVGATVCTPRRPACGQCPFSVLCVARAAGVESTLPRMIRSARPRTVDVAFGYIRRRGRTLLVRRPDTKLLGGLWSLPGGELPRGAGIRAGLNEMMATQVGARVDVREELARVNHTFSHRRWRGRVLRCVPRGPIGVSRVVRWVADAEISQLPLVPAHRRILEDLRSRPSLESFARRGRAGRR